MDSPKMCARCGSLLIELSRTTKELNSSQSPMTTIIYQCSNSECQAAIDKKKAEVEAQRLEREARALNRQALKS